MDGEVSALVESLRAGAGRLAADLSAVETGMSELYDAASGRGGACRRARAAAAVRVQSPASPSREAPLPSEPELDSALQAPPQPAGRGGAGAGGQEVGGDLDGARLIALNMALNGESRADTERYLAENFQLPDRLKLIDEVYAGDRGLSGGPTRARSLRERAWGERSVRLR